MRRHAAWLALLPWTLGSCYLFCDEGRPCDEEEGCLPGYVCVEGRCVTSESKAIGEECKETGECVSGAVCASYCPPAEVESCTSPVECGNQGDELWLCEEGSCACKTRCRQDCDYPDQTSCPEGLLCFFDTDQELGFCQEGLCGETSDGTHLGNCGINEVCLNLNGPGSGVCHPTCTILEQNLSCLEPSPPSNVQCCYPNENCEHIPQMWNPTVNPDGSLGVCFASGDRDEGSPCSNDTAADAFCQRGLICHNNFCRQYCNLRGGAPGCDDPTHICIAFAGGELLPYGWCSP